MLSNHLILCRPLFLPPSIFPSIRVFSKELALHIRWPKYWSFSFSISPSYECSGLTSFRMDWLDLLEVQGTLKSLLQHHSLKASILQRSAFFTIQLSHPNVTTGETITRTAKWVLSSSFNKMTSLGGVQKQPWGEALIGVLHRVLNIWLPHGMKTRITEWALISGSVVFNWGWF